MSKKAWVVTWRSIDPSREEALGSRVYLSESKLKKDLLPTLKDLAKTELDSYEHSAEDEELLIEIQNGQDFWDTYNLWAEYVRDFDPEESVEIEETFRA